MADVFVSYAREDQGAAADLHARLQQGGLDVWWDARLEVGARFHDDIARALSDARVVLVLWSPHSVNSPWVLDEAARARDADKLIPLRIADVPIPLSFGTLNTLDLELPWGDEQLQKIDQLAQAIRERLQAATAARPQAGEPGSQPQARTTRAAPPRRASAPAGKKTAWLFALIAAAVVAGGALVVAKWPKQAPVRACAPSSDRAVELTDKAMDVASTGNYQRALLYYDQAVSADGTYQPAYLWRAHSYLNTGDRARAEADLALLLKPPCCNERACEEGRELLASLRKPASPAADAGVGAAGPKRADQVRDMFAPGKERRIGATTALTVDVGRDPQIVPDAVGAALAQPDNASGVVNTLVVLQNAPRATIKANRPQIVSLLGKVRDNGPLTAERVAKLEQSYPELRASTASTPERPRTNAVYRIELAKIQVEEDGKVTLPVGRLRSGTEWAFDISLGGASVGEKKVLKVPVLRYDDKKRPQVRPRGVSGTIGLPAGEPLVVTVSGTRTEGPVHAKREMRWDSSAAELQIPVQAPNRGDGSFVFFFTVTKQQ